MNAYVFRISMESIDLLATIESINSRALTIANSIECVVVIGKDKGDAHGKASRIRDDRIAFVNRIVQNPIQSIGRAGNGF
jgi:hypothetical protein